MCIYVCTWSFVCLLISNSNILNLKSGLQNDIVNFLTAVLCLYLTE